MGSQAAGTAQLPVTQPILLYEGPEIHTVYNLIEGSIFIGL